MCIIEFASVTPLYLVLQRPKKGLLANLWDFPLVYIKDSTSVSSHRRFELMSSFMLSTLGMKMSTCDADEGLFISGKTHLGTISHIFSHVKWNMNVDLVSVPLSDKLKSPPDLSSLNPDSSIPLATENEMTFDWPSGARWVSEEELLSGASPATLKKSWSLLQKYRANNNNNANGKKKIKTSHDGKKQLGIAQFLKK